MTIMVGALRFLDAVAPLSLVALSFGFAVEVVLVLDFVAFEALLEVVSPAVGTASRPMFAK